MYLFSSNLQMDTAIIKDVMISWILLLSSITELVGQKLGPEYQTSVKYCVSKSQCDTRNHEICWWSYDGCARGQCMCDPRTHFKDKNGKCRKLKQGRESCSKDDRCPEGMMCRDFRCECEEGTMTPDRKVCLKNNEKLLGQICTPSTDICYQVSAQHGYTSREVECNPFEYMCKCKEGYKEDMGECRKWKINEPGCSRDHHCQGGALCIDGTCRCPTGYKSVSHDSKCAKDGATTNLGIGAACDEINERRYCARNLVCHKCLGDSYYTCVQFSEAKQQRFIADFSASQKLHHSTLLMLVSFLLGSIYTRMR